MKITAHCLVKNEERFIRFAINSVIDFVDEIIIWDQGSIDSTIDIIKSIKSPKLKFKKVTGEVSMLRQKMIDETNSDWIFILDGDEVWYESGLSELRSKLGDKYSCVVVPNYMLIGDMYHYQERLAGKYEIAGVKGHYNIRLVKNSPGLHVEGVYPDEAYVNGSSIKVQNLPKNEILFLSTPYLHASFLTRSTKDTKKVKYEIGEKFPLDFYYPESFFKGGAVGTLPVWGNMPNGYRIKAAALTPLKKLKRRII